MLSILRKKEHQFSYINYTVHVVLCQFLLSITTYKVRGVQYWLAGWLVGEVRGHKSYSELRGPTMRRVGDGVCVLLKCSQKMYNLLRGNVERFQDMESGRNKWTAFYFHFLDCSPRRTRYSSGRCGVGNK